MADSARARAYWRERRVAYTLRVHAARRATSRQRRSVDYHYTIKNTAIEICVK